MTDKTFPPPQALRVVPLEAAELMRTWMSQCRPLWLNGSPLLRLVEFVEQFRPQALPEMTVAGGFNEITITDETVDADMLDLIRINGRVFAPEAIVVDGGSDGLKNCQNCGGDCRVETFGPADHIEGTATVWLCSNSPLFGGNCSNELAYLSAEAWNNRLDEDDLTQIIDDTLGPDWTARTAARAVHAELYGEAGE
jgi:hypothetical protein